MTAVANSVFTAAQFNQFVRDNLNETAPAKATTAGSHFAVSSTNQIAERTMATAFVLTSETTTSTSFTDLATPGPAVTVTTGVNAFVFVHGDVSNSGTGSVRMAYDTSGATTLAAADNRGINHSGVASVGVAASACVIQTGLTPGSNTFTAKYRVSASTGTFINRRIGVIPF
jgi:hypothetical protein